MCQGKLRVCRQREREQDRVSRSRSYLFVSRMGRLPRVGEGRLEDDDAVQPYTFGSIGDVERSQQQSVEDLNVVATAAGIRSQE